MKNLISNLPVVFVLNFFSFLFYVGRFGSSGNADRVGNDKWWLVICRFSNWATLSLTTSRKKINSLFWSIRRKKKFNQIKNFSLNRSHSVEFLWRNEIESMLFEFFQTKKTVHFTKYIFNSTVGPQKSIEYHLWYVHHFFFSGESFTFQITNFN